jgi:hypothetical protein
VDSAMSTFRLVLVGVVDPAVDEDPEWPHTLDVVL